MHPMATRNDLADFLNNPENAQELNGLVEDIRHTLMDYWVSTPEWLALTISDIYLRHHYKETSITKTVS